MFLPSFSLLVGGQDKVSDLFTSFVSVSPLPLEKLLPGSDVGNGDCYRGQLSARAGHSHRVLGCRLERQGRPHRQGLSYYITFIYVVYV